MVLRGAAAHAGVVILPTVDQVLDALRGAADLVLPTSCASCGGPASAPLCGTCRPGLRAVAPAVLALSPARTPCWSALPFDGPLRTAVSAYKDGGRRDLLEPLAAVLAGAVGRAAGEDPVLRRARRHDERVLVVPVPPAGRSRRRRGDDPVGALVRRAVDRLDDDTLVVVEALAHTRRVADQARLGRRARADNLGGALRVLPAARPAVRGSVCLVVDDVVTSGATLTEAARALRASDARHVVAATLAATPRHVTAESLVGDRSCG